MSQTLSSSKAKTLTMPGGRVVVLPSDAEDAQINAGIAADPAAYEMTSAEFKQLRRGRPLGSGKKVQVTLRLDADLLEKFRSTGAGWQTRVNDALKSWSERHA
ncbi:MAG: BrnA antitoxin family protein [Rhodoferax sp.]